MQKSFIAFFSGLSMAVLAAYLLRELSPRRQRALRLFDLNQCSIGDLRSLGLEQGTAEKIVESRPYRSKLELVSRIMLSNELYLAVKNRVSVADPNEPVKIAS